MLKIQALILYSVARLHPLMLCSLIKIFLLLFFRCTVRQEDETGKILYSYSDFIRIHVNAMPPPLPVISYAEKVGNFLILIP